MSHDEMKRAHEVKINEYSHGANYANLEAGGRNHVSIHQTCLPQIDDSDYEGQRHSVEPLRHHKKVGDINPFLLKPTAGAA